MSINTNTGMSVGVMVVLIAGIIFIIRGQNDVKNELSMQAVVSKNELASKIDKVENRMVTIDTRVTALENAKNVWTFGEMLRWAIHLQQLNKDPKKIQTEGLIVPEPEVTQK